MKKLAVYHLALLAVLLVVLTASAACAGSVSVRFYADSQLILVERPVPTGMPAAEAAVRALVDGPTQAELSAGISSAIPAGVTITSLSITADAAHVDLSAGVVAGLSEGSLSHIFDQFRTTLGDFPAILSIRLTCAGKTLASYLAPSPQVGLPAAPVTRQVTGVGLSGKKICVGPSHGRYWSGTISAWTWQRSDPCGFGEAVLEDTNSIRLVQFLKQYLTQDGATFVAPRQLDETDCCHADTGLPWWKVCASTRLHYLGYPSSIWAAVSGIGGSDDATDRYSDDIRSRPLFADSENADIYIAHHTNAGGGGTANGTETFRDTLMEHPEHVANSLTLATSVQSNIIDAIRTTFEGETGWANRGVKDSAAGFGEIRVPNRPACLIELGFHDNCSRDALYLTDDFFRSVAEWGVYKGVCAYFGNTPTWDKYSCEYVSDTIPTTMTPGVSYPVSITYRNRGVSWFTSRGFRLGAVGESDPFAGFTRVDISGQVKPGNTYTFNFALTAPSTGGTHTTEWRMVRDGYAWFGPTVTKVIDCGPILDVTPPTVPANLHTTSVTATSVALAWDASTDESGVSGYTVYRNGAALGTTTGTSYTDSNLAQNTTYSYEVDAYDAVNNFSAKCAPLVVTTLIVATWGPNNLTSSQSIYYPSNYNVNLRTGWYTTTAGTGAARSILKAGDSAMATMPAQAMVTGATFSIAFTQAGTYSSTANNPTNIYRLNRSWTAGAGTLWNTPWTTAGGDYSSVGTAAQDTIYPATGTIYTFKPTGTNGWFPYGVMLKGNTESSITYRKAWQSSGPYPSLAVTYTPPTPTIRDWAYLGHYLQGAAADHVTRIDTDHVAGTYDGVPVTESSIAPGAANGTGVSYGNSYGTAWWKSATATNDLVDLLSAPFYNVASNDNGTTYAAAYVYNSGAANSAVYMGVGSDNDVKTYLNGALVGSWVNAAGRGVVADNDFYGPMTLNAGWNRLLVKVENGTGGYGLYARFANVDRTALSGLSVYTSDATAPTNPTSCVEAGGAVDNVLQSAVSSPSFSWTGAADPQGSGEGVSGVRGYKLYFGADPAGVPTLFQTAATFAPGAQQGGVFYLRVSTVDYALNQSTPVTLFTFRYLGVPPTTTATPAGGVYNAAQSVVLSSPGAAAIYYTTDGTEPTTGSPTYSGSIPVSTDITLRFFGVGTGGAVETPSKQETYNILAADGSIADAKAAELGAEIRLGDKALYFKNGSFGYIEEASRLAGMRIEGTIGASEGDLVCLVGTRAKTADDEPIISVTQLTANGTAAIAPWGTNSRAFQYNLLDGLCVTTWGLVKTGSLTANSFVLTCGTADTEVTVITKGAPAVTEGSFTTVTGAVGFGTTRVIYLK